MESAAFHDAARSGTGSPPRLLPGWGVAATEILLRGMWCVIEVCTDVPTQRWEPRMVICRQDHGGVEHAVEEWIEDCPGMDVRIAGYTRDRLHRVKGTPTALCHIASA